MTTHLNDQVARKIEIKSNHLQVSFLVAKPRFQIVTKSGSFTRTHPESGLDKTIRIIDSLHLPNLEKLVTLVAYNFVEMTFFALIHAATFVCTKRGASL